MIVVCSLSAAHEQIQVHGAVKAISILAPPSEHPVFETVEGHDHLRLTFHDIAAPTHGLSAPGEHDIQRLLGFLRSWEGPKPLLIHCWAGISRSTAAAYIASCMFKPRADETELAWALRHASPSATPNPMLVSLADHALNREGRMTRAIQAIGRGEDAYEGAPFTLDVQPPV
jgi:predicted protein tyrosine phosphatase